MPQRLAALRLGFSVQEVGQPFGFRKIDLAVVEGAAGKLPRFGQAKATDLAQGIEHRVHHGATPVQHQLGDILASEAAWSGKPEDYAPVQRATVDGMDEQAR